MAWGHDLRFYRGFGGLAFWEEGFECGNFYCWCENLYFVLFLMVDLHG